MLKNYEFWLVIGSQFLYGQEVLDTIDRRFMLAIIEKFAGGPVGIDNLASAVGEDRETLEDVVEPYLIQQGLVQRTVRGRMATALAYRHFGLAAPSTHPAAADLFGDLF